MPSPRKKSAKKQLLLRRPVRSQLSRREKDKN